MAREIQHGLSGYRRGCKCETCRRAKRDSMREYRARRTALDGAEAEVLETARTLDPLAPVPAFRRDVPAGPIEAALAGDLDKLTGEPPWKGVLSALARFNARMLDQAPDMDRLDLVSPLQLRIVEDLKLLRAVSAGAGSSAADQFAQMLRDMDGAPEHAAEG